MAGNQTTLQAGPLAAPDLTQKVFHNLPQQQYYQLQHLKQQQLLLQQGIVFDGRRLRKGVNRRSVDYNVAVIKHMEERIWRRGTTRVFQPDVLYQTELVPPCAELDKPVSCVMTKFVKAATNKIRCPVFSIAWQPDGKRLITGSASGEFTLWNGLTFAFETILQAHDSSVRALKWNHGDQWLISGDHNGYVKYWQQNMNNVKMFQAHREAVRGLDFAPSDVKFASCADDSTIRIWDFARCEEEQILRGHGAEVKTIAWHPTLGIIASGSKDAQQPLKLWDPKSAQCLTTVFAHKAGVMDMSWNSNGRWLLTGSKDHTAKLFDIRNLKSELMTYKGHKREVSAIAWHPIHKKMFCTGGSDGQICFWTADFNSEIGGMESGHDAVIWNMAWHPMGHILATCSNDHSTRFWSRNRPGDVMRDKFNKDYMDIEDGEVRCQQVDAQGDVILPRRMQENQEQMRLMRQRQYSGDLPGLGIDQNIKEHINKQLEKESGGIPGFDPSEARMAQQQFVAIDRKRRQPNQNINSGFQQAWSQPVKRPALLDAPPDANFDTHSIKDHTMTGAQQKRSALLYGAQNGSQEAGPQGLLPPPQPSGMMPTQWQRPPANWGQAPAGDTDARTAWPQPGPPVAPQSYQSHPPPQWQQRPPPRPWNGPPHGMQGPPRGPHQPRGPLQHPPPRGPPSGPRGPGAGWGVRPGSGH